jgi:hypothetical protein
LRVQRSGGGGRATREDGRQGRTSSCGRQGAGRGGMLQLRRRSSVDLPVIVGPCLIIHLFLLLHLFRRRSANGRRRGPAAASSPIQARLGVGAMAQQLLACRRLPLALLRHLCHAARRRREHEAAGAAARRRADAARRARRQGRVARRDELRGEAGGQHVVGGQQVRLAEPQAPAEILEPTPRLERGAAFGED